MKLSAAKKVIINCKPHKPQAKNCYSSQVTLHLRDEWKVRRTG